jgi:hypothetical protein
MSTLAELHEQAQQITALRKQLTAKCSALRKGIAAARQAGESATDLDKIATSLEHVAQEHANIDKAIAQLSKLSKNPHFSHVASIVPAIKEMKAAMLTPEEIRAKLQETQASMTTKGVMGNLAGGPHDLRLVRPR